MNRDDVNRAFDTVLAFDSALQKEYARRERIESLRRRCDRRCGNCYNWMKTPLCWREAAYRDRRGTCVSMNDTACGDFVPSADAQAARTELEKQP